MNIHMLGSITITTQKGDFTPQAERVRNLLASLSWHPGRFLSDEAAIDQLWGDDLPLHPRNALYTYANRLRKLFLAADPVCAGSILFRRRGGYVLSIDPDAVDMHRFHCLVQAAQTAIRSRDDRTALAHLDQGLALWRGDPLSGLTSNWATQVRTTLRREWLTAVTMRQEARLRLGRHFEVLAELFELAEANPFDERIASSLMLALFRSGRQRDALTHYVEMRSRLIDEVGTEPSAALRELHHRIIRQDGGLLIQEQ